LRHEALRVERISARVRKYFHPEINAKEERTSTRSGQIKKPDNRSGPPSFAVIVFFLSGQIISQVGKALVSFDNRLMRS